MCLIDLIIEEFVLRATWLPKSPSFVFALTLLDRTCIKLTNPISYAYS